MFACTLRTCAWHSTSSTHVKTRKRENGKVTIQIVETVRRGMKVYQKTLRTVATVFADEVDRFMELADHIKSEIEADRLPNFFSTQTLAEMVVFSRNRSIGDESPLAVNLRTIREESRIVTGIHDIYMMKLDSTVYSNPVL